MRIERNLTLSLVWKEHHCTISIFWVFMICLIALTEDYDNKLHENPSPQLQPRPGGVGGEKDVA